MQLHRNAKLGLAGRFALVKTIEAGCSIREAARRHWRLAGDGVHVVAALAGGQRGGAAHARLLGRSLESAAALAADAEHRRAGADLRRTTAFGAPLAVFAGHGIEPKRLMTDNAWSYTRNRSLRELLAARQIRHLTTKPHLAAHQRQGRTLHPNAQARMGIRPRLRQLRPPPPRTAILAPPLQPRQAAQLTRRPPTHQPRSERL